MHVVYIGSTFNMSNTRLPFHKYRDDKFTFISFSPIRAKIKFFTHCM